MLKYELIIIWDTGEREAYLYDKKERAEDILQGYKMAFGNQVEWIGINEVHR